MLYHQRGCSCSKVVDEELVFVLMVRKVVSTYFVAGVWVVLVPTCRHVEGC